MDPKLLTRDSFREAVFARDNHKCIFCGKTADQTPEGKLDAHHIMERRLWPDYGYYLENGASVCEEHHLACEQTKITVEEVRDAAGITRKWVPPQFYDDHIYDKWGNPILEDGRRGKGELFFDESVQKVLTQGGVIDKFTPYVKYGRTFHLPWSPGINDDDKALHDASQFYGKRVIVTKKMDGENTTMYRDHIHARSIDSKGGEDRAFVKRIWSAIAHEIDDGWRICGENLWAEHSIHYYNLPSYFLAFSIWNERNICLSWDDTLVYLQVLGLAHVPVLFDGMYEDCNFRKIEFNMNPAQDEGYVIRIADQFTYGEFKSSMAKYVRKGHVQTTKHWRAGRAFIPNGLAKGD